MHLEIHNGDLRFGIEIDFPLDTTHTQHILALQVAGVAPPVHLDGEQIFTGSKHGAYIKLGRRFGTLRVASIQTIDIEIHG